MDLRALEEHIEKQSQWVRRVRAEIGKVIVGQEYLIDRLLVALIADGHALLEGVPGLAKTLTVSTLARTLATKFQRIQFTPDLLPGDIIGTMIYDEREHDFFPRQGPIFANLILADEINRAPAKVQSALLEAMQERQVTIGQTTFPLQQPFLVMATQNPIEQEGTYPLPEAQVDRFMLKLLVTYPTRDQELEILRRWTQLQTPEAAVVAGPDDVLAARAAIHEIHMEDVLERYIVDLVWATREPREVAREIRERWRHSPERAVAGHSAVVEENLRRLEECENLISYGASPRATLYLALAARAHAFIRGRAYVTPDDILEVGMDVLRHRVIVSYEAEAQMIDSDQIVRRIFDTVEVP
ncbi:MAG: AAA family ATPase [Armatimonadetes bacterium]|nr:AAA family ATPase [Armatimonadota bacterium]